MKTDKEIISELRLKIKELEEKIQFLTRKYVHSHDLMNYIIEHSRSAIAVHDRDLNYIFVSEKYLNEYHVREKDIIGRHHYEIFPDLPQKWRDVHQRALRGEILSAEDDPYEKADGTVEWTRWECRPWFDSDGSIGGIIVYTEVITKRKEAELELIKAKERAEESDRLKSAFLQNMSHEVRTPLNTIVGFSQLISESEFSTPNMKFYADMISSSSEKLIGIISDVIDISQIRTNQVKTTISQTDIQNIATKIAGFYKEAALKKKIDYTFTSNIAQTLPLIYTDSNKVEKIFRHLIDNAVKFTDSGFVRVATYIRDDYFIFEVSDSGIGIPVKMQEKVFEPFRQVETELCRAFGGNGLGLTIVKAYTEMLYGCIELDSEPGKGTIVKAKFPLEIGEKMASATEQQSITDKFTLNKVLIVEDEYSSYMYLKELLRDEKVRILRASNGAEAVNVCRENTGISMILMDVKMPVMDGYTAASQIKAFLPGVPIIAQTAFALESDRENYLKTFDDLITKPIRKNEFMILVRKYIGQKTI